MDSNVRMVGGGEAITNETYLSYINRSHQLWKRAAVEYKINEQDMTFTSFVTWLQSLLPYVKTATRRQYIAATKAYLSNKKTQVSFDISPKDADLNSAILIMDNIRAANYPTHSSITKQWRQRTSGQKAKKCSNEDLKLIISQSKKMRGKWIEASMLWMVVNVMVGLRPSEWKSAVLLEAGQQKTLVIKNGKATNGRANGAHRHIDVTALNEAELKLIQFQLKIVAKYNQSDVEWNSYYSGVRKTIHRITRLAFSSQRKYPTLYSTRHQFSADAKSAGLSKVEVAALMGHATDETAGLHYGKKKHGSGNCKVMPNAGEVATVKKAPKTQMTKLGM